MNSTYLQDSLAAPRGRVTTASTHDRRSGGSSRRGQLARYCAVMVVSAAVSLRAFAQDNLRAAANDEIIRLPQFTVNAEDTNRSRLSVSTTRIATDLMDVPQSVSVIPLNTLQAAFALRAIDALAYTAGVQDSTLPNNIDRVQIRGVLSERTVQDGFDEQYMDGNSKLWDIEALELIRGPNAIVAPNGPAGGTINRITKIPSFTQNSFFRLALSQYLPGRDTMVDSTGPIGDSKNWAYRLVAGYADGREWRNRGHVIQKGIYPSLMYRPNDRFSVTAAITLEEYCGQGGVVGIIDPNTPATTPINNLWSGQLFFPVNAGSAVGPCPLPRSYKREMRIFADFNINEYLSTTLRLRANNSTYSEGGPQTVLTAADQSAVNPLTGYYTPGFKYGPAPTFTPIPTPIYPIPVPNPGFSQVPTQANWTPNNDRKQLDVRNDWVLNFSNQRVLPFESTSLVGFQLDKQEWLLRQYAMWREGNGAYQAWEYPIPAPYVTGNLTNYINSEAFETIAYVHETLSLFNKRLQVNLGQSYYSVDVNRLDNFVITSAPIYNGVPVYSNHGVAHPYTLGAVVKVTPQISLFVGKNTNASLAGVIRGAPFNPAILLTEGSQVEYGAKGNFFKGKLFTSVTYFQLAQSNVAVTNPKRLDPVYANDPTVPQVIYSDQKIHGLEWEISGDLTKDISLRGNYTYTIDHNFYGQPVRDVARNAYSVQLIFRPPLPGLETWAGVKYIGRRAGTNPTAGYTAASTLDHIILYQPLFIVDSHTLVNVGVGYAFKKHWKLSVTVDNLMNQTYLIGTGARTAGCYLGYPRNVSGMIEYKF